MAKSKKNAKSADYDHYVEKSDVNDQNTKSQNWSELKKSTHGVLPMDTNSCGRLGKGQLG